MSIEAIKEVSINKVISKYVELKKKGVNHTGLCPFHNEKTPSFSVSETKGIFKCFGCGAGGNAITFLMKHDRLTFVEACSKIAKDNGIDWQPKKITPEEEKKQILINEILVFHQIVADWFIEQLDAEKEAKNYVEKRISKENQELFQVGFAPPGWNKLFEAMQAKGYKEEFLLKTNLFRQKDNGQVFDFFQNRIMFPIWNNAGQIIAFSGRVMDDTKPKYINSPESEWYDKSKVLYAFNLAIKEKADYINITEGYTDVMSMRDAKQRNTAALCGTALTEKHIKLIQRYTNNVNIVLDNDTAGDISAYKSAKALIKEGCKVTQTTTIPEGMDPDDYFKKPDHVFNRENFILKLCKDFFTGASEDPLERADNVREIAGWLNLLPQVERDAMVDYLAKTFKKEGITKNSLRSALNGSGNSETDEREFEMDEKSLPKYVDRKEYRKYGFYASRGEKGDMFAKNQYIFDGINRISNFVMIPLYHIKSDMEVKKLFQIENKYGEKNVIEVDMEAMNSLPRFKRTIESVGNNLFEGTDKHLTHLKRKWYDDTKYCQHITHLGFQKDGFWAWANGITTVNDDFLPVDENGIIIYKDKNYFIPAFSAIYKDKQGLFESERRFKFIKSDIGFHEWAKLFIDVFGSQSKISIAFYLTSLFSDYIFSRLGNLPILNFYGQKGTGKNEQAASLMALFGKIQNPLQIHNTTKAGLASHMEEFKNAMFWIDEYKNNLSLDLIEGIKGIYNRLGRTRRSMKEGQGKEITNVNSMGIVTGQEMLTIDVALFSRVIFLPYYKTEFKEREKENLEKLHHIQENGLSHITAKILKNRKDVEDNYIYAFNEVNKDLGKALNFNQVDTRIARNLTTVLATFKCLEKSVDLPFSYKELINEARDNIIRHNEFLFSSNELAQFWSIIENGVENYKITEDKNFKIKLCDYLRIQVNKKSKDLHYKPPKEVFLLKWSGIYNYYAETANRSNQTVLPESTLKYYLETSAPFIGKVKSVRFENETNQARAFDYKLLEKELSRKSKNEFAEYEADDTEESSNNNDNDVPDNKNKGKTGEMDFDKGGDVPF